MLGSVLMYFKDVTILLSIILLYYTKLYLIGFHMKLKVSKLDFCI